VILTGASATAATAAGQSPAGRPGQHYPLAGGNPHATGELPSPPRPSAGLPAQPPGYRAPDALAARLSKTLTAPHASPGPLALPAGATTWGDTGPASTLVLYDTTGTWGWLGELYAIGAGNLATHFGAVTAEPVADYVAGQVNDYTATIYLGSTYDEPLPASFTNDVLSTSKPVIWVGNNIWQLSGASGGAADTAFESQYGWDPSTSYFDTTDSIPAVTYKGTDFTRSLDNTAGVLAPHITSPSQVQVLATADCATTAGVATDCASVAQTTGASFPWAISSGNLTYVGEIPFSYMSYTDRYVAFSDLLFASLEPDAPASHLALIRFDDINPTASDGSLDQLGFYLQNLGVPFSMAVTPEWVNPNNVPGVVGPLNLTQEPADIEPPVMTALKTAVSDGGTIIQNGYTHQYSNVDNPFTAATGDLEFYRAQCSTTDTPPYGFQGYPCAQSDYVIEEGPLPGDSRSWAYNRVVTGQALFTSAGLAAPTIWETPGNVASAADYAGIGQVYSTRYEEDTFYGGELSGQPLDYSHVFGQFFPYEVHDLYGATVIPENLGEDTDAEYGNPARSVQDILNEAQQNLVVTQGVASFYLEYVESITSIEQLVSGLRAEGYTFVSPQSFLASNG
jgi:uncharacterized protein YdaL